MVSLAVCILNSITRFFRKPRTQSTGRHLYEIPWPRVLHKELDSQFLEGYDEIFVIGDVHGCYDELVELLKVADATSNSVLKLFVGDLINKGPKSRDVLRLVRHSSSMFSVRGNHEEIILRAHFKFKLSGFPLKENSLWVKDLSADEVCYLSDLPYTISLPSLNSIIVHAGLVPGYPKECADPVQFTTMRNVVEGDYFWKPGMLPSSSADAGEAWAKMWGGPEHVYFGHDAKRKLQQEFCATGLDTGCVYGGHLTGIFIHGKRKGELVQVKAFEVYEPPKLDENGQ